MEGVVYEKKTNIGSVGRTNRRRYRVEEGPDEITERRAKKAMASFNEERRIYKVRLTGYDGELKSEWLEFSFDLANERAKWAQEKYSTVGNVTISAFEE